VGGAPKNVALAGTAFRIQRTGGSGLGKSKAAFFVVRARLTGNSPVESIVCEREDFQN
jgi:hypothetical protein